jgi:hypothetical protein
MMKMSLPRSPCVPAVKILAPRCADVDLIDVEPRADVLVLLVALLLAVGEDADLGDVGHAGDVLVHVGRVVVGLGVVSGGDVAAGRLASGGATPPGPGLSCHGRAAGTG